MALARGQLPSNDTRIMGSSNMRRLATAAAVKNTQRTIGVSIRGVLMKAERTVGQAVWHLHARISADDSGGEPA